MGIHPFSPEGRQQALQEMGKQTVDLLIIGGGITGSGLARDAALRGLKVALVEKVDFGYGTSSRSSKLVHGGVRYLAYGEVNLVRESARERKVLKKIAPHLIHSLPFVFPLYKGESLMKFRAGFFLFDKLAGSTKFEKHKVLSVEEVRESVPALRDPLIGGIVYGEYITEDARFTLLNAISAAEQGALVANHAEVTDFIIEGDKVIGAKVTDKLSGETYGIHAKVTVNATGPWAEQLLVKERLSTPKKLLLSKGIHIVFDAARIPIKGAVALKSPSGKEGFMIRRWNYVYVGTTDVQHDGIIDQPQADRDAMNHLLGMSQECFPDLNLTEDDILGTWAGVRPLISEGNKSSRDTSRHDEIWKIKDGLLTVAGGKLTTYRPMADRIMTSVGKELGIELPDNHLTEEVILPGGDIKGDFEQFKGQMTKRLANLGFSDETAERLIWLYGTAIENLLQYANEDPAWLEPIALGIPAIKAEVRLALEKEMALSLTDFLDRRSALLIFSKDHGVESAKTVAHIMGERLQWSDEHKKEQINIYLELQQKHLTDSIRV
ncbi:glycerol-3-phosphate dehydrogenase [Paenibacillaceae bacterium GAS479]|nr:glycerol-3-phosphate dehydrogenase [Paenibacillaceae bacterium GAS479]